MNGCGNCKTERLGRHTIHDEIEDIWLRDRELRRARAFEDSIYVVGRPTIQVGDADTVARQPAGVRGFALEGHRWETVSQGELRDHRLLNHHGLRDRHERRIHRIHQHRSEHGGESLRKDQIERDQAWQSYIETTFNIQRRMADWHFAHAQSWSDLREAHDRWVAHYNYQIHWAHRDREDGRRSPAEILSWVTGTGLLR
jgi:hypothetical protein